MIRLPRRTGVLVATGLLALGLLAVGCGTRVALGELPSDPADSNDPTSPPPEGSGRATNDAGNAPEKDAAGGSDAGEAQDAGGYVPCANKKCGESCALCPPNDPNCAETAVLKFCNANGECKDTTPKCDYDPCAGKVCGQSCTICPPNDPNCFETAVLKQCSKSGQCNAGNANCN